MVDRVQLPGYEIWIESGSTGLIPERLREVLPAAHRFAVIADSNLESEALRLCQGLGDRGFIFLVESGEENKSRASWLRLTDEMLASGLARDSAVVAVGGGMVGDLAGFVAATFMRGIPWVNVPTSLLAMIDSSIGGKTGVDTPAGKNLVGAFHNPERVFIDQQLLATLPLTHLRAGLAEAIKHGVIADAAYLQEVAGSAPALLAAAGSGEETLSLIRGSVGIKASVVSRDEREDGIRRILNFGHTIGHAVERASDFGLLHGEAVAIGMVAESRLAELAGVGEQGLADGVERVVRAVGLPTTIPGYIDRDRVWSALRLDKKQRGGRVAFALPIRPGLMAGAAEGWAVEIEDGLISEVLQ